MAMPHNISCQVWIVEFLHDGSQPDSLDHKIQLFWIFGCTFFSSYLLDALVGSFCFAEISLDFIHWSPRFLLSSFFFSSSFHLSSTYLSYVCLVPMSSRSLPRFLFMCLPACQMPWPDQFVQSREEKNIQKNLYIGHI